MVFPASDVDTRRPRWYIDADGDSRLVVALKRIKKNRARHRTAAGRARKVVPCNGCTLCCQGDAIRLEPEDRPSDYLTEPHPYIRGALMLAHKPNGECIYLGEHGCTIHDRAPSLCQSADCRSVAASIDLQTALRLHAMGRLDFRVWDQGHKLLAAMASEEEKLKP